MKCMLMFSTTVVQMECSMVSTAAVQMKSIVFSSMKCSMFSALSSGLDEVHCVHRSGSEEV